MIRGLGRLLLLRFLPRRMLPVLTAWEILQIVRQRRRARAAAIEAEADVDTRRTQPPPTPRTRRRA